MVFRIAETAPYSVEFSYIMGCIFLDRGDDRWKGFGNSGVCKENISLFVTCMPETVHKLCVELSICSEVC
jgi:hypothetical protein